jgi:PKD repeat protein
MPENNNIENIFKERFENYSVKPNQSVWSTINRKLFYIRFFKFNPLRFNLWYGLAIVITGTFLLINPIKTEFVSNDNTGKVDINNHQKIKVTNTDQIITHGVIEQKNANFESNNQNQTEKESESLPDNLIRHNDNTIVIDPNTNKETDNNNNEIKTSLIPVPDFKIDDYSVCESSTITFVNTSQNCESYLWDFGNGITSSIENPSINYKTAGNYTVSLKCLCENNSTTVKKSISILPIPEAKFTVKNPNLIFSGEKAEFLFIGSNSSENQWFFGDGNMTKGVNPTNTYEEEGKYKVTLISSRSECTDTFVTDIIVRDTKYKISVPTAFTPDLNGPGNGYWKTESRPNSIFYPVLNYETRDFKLKIYDKFGNLMFMSNNPDFGWNGWYNNKPAITNVYIWECEVKFIDGETFYKKGNVTLLHSEY